MNLSDLTDVSPISENRDIAVAGKSTYLAVMKVSEIAEILRSHLLGMV